MLVHKYPKELSYGLQPFQKQIEIIELWKRMVFYISVAINMSLVCCNYTVNNSSLYNFVENLSVKNAMGLEVFDFTLSPP